MRKTNLKGFAASLLAAAMVLTSTVGVMAAVTTKEEETVGAVTYIDIPKDVVMFNTDGSAIYQPAVTYTYEVTPAAVVDATHVTGRIVEDTANKATVKVKAGPTAAISLANDGKITFGTDSSSAAPEVSTYTEGTTVAKNTTNKISGNLRISFDSSKFLVDSKLTPGIYRYKIEETANTMDSADVVRKDGYITTRYLDVYVRWTSAARDALEVYGTVVFKKTSSTDVDAETSIEYDSSSETAIKVKGYDVASEFEDGASHSDEYHTYNVTVKKTVAGSLADKDHEFPFEIRTAAGGTSSARFTYTDHASSATTIGSNINEGYGDALKLKDGAEVVLTGLPKSATLAVGELNDTLDVYAPSATIKAGSATASVAGLTIEDGFVNGKKATLTAAAPNEGQRTGRALTSDTIEFTNTLSEISPTGLVFRYSPYAILLGAACLLLAAMHRRDDKNIR